MVADLWTLPVAALEAPALTALSQTLSDEERDRAARFHFERDRRAFLAAHGLLRRALSARWPTVQPQDWRFAAPPGGRPEVEAPALDARPRFNLSHTAELVACVVTDGPACGIDVEASNVELDLEALGERVLTPAERAEMGSLADGRVERFLRLWTLKEAYAKACGLGLAMPFDELAFTLGDEIELSRDADWTFGQWPVPPAHILSVAVRGQVHIEFRSVPGW